jgi:hypothetical protein
MGEGAWADAFGVPVSAEKVEHDLDTANGIAALR